MDTRIAQFQSYIGKPRTALPWLKPYPPNILDCAIGFSYIAGLKPVQINCNGIKALCVANKTWRTTGLPVAGQAVIFDWSGRKKAGDHVGMVISANPRNVTYVSADSGPHKLVTITTVPYNLVTGWGSPKP